MNPFTDKYFTKAKLVAQYVNKNPVVSYRVFCRDSGIAALEPARLLIKTLAPDARVQVLPEGTKFESGDTLMIITDKFQNIVELETMYLGWIGLPIYCATQARAIRDAALDKDIMDFAARHLCGAESVVLASYGARIGGINKHSTDVGAVCLQHLAMVSGRYCNLIDQKVPWIFMSGGIGTMPHALLAIFNGNYCEAANAYLNALRGDKFIALIDYNNREIDDSLKLLKEFGKELYGVRIDTPRENHAQIKPSDTTQLGSIYDDGVGVTINAVNQLRYWLDHNTDASGHHVKIFVSSGFNSDKTKEFYKECKDSFDGIGTGSFVPKFCPATADIFMVDGREEAKVGRYWGFAKNVEFYRKIAH